MHYKNITITITALLLAGIFSACGDQRGITQPLPSPATDASVSNVAPSVESDKILALQEQIKSLEDQLAEVQASNDSEAIEDLKASIEQLKAQLDAINQGSENDELKAAIEQLKAQIEQLKAELDAINKGEVVDAGTEGDDEVKPSGQEEPGLLSFLEKVLLVQSVDYQPIGNHIVVTFPRPIDPTTVPETTKKMVGNTSVETNISLINMSKNLKMKASVSMDGKNKIRIDTFTPPTFPESLVLRLYGKQPSAKAKTGQNTDKNSNSLATHPIKDMDGNPLAITQQYKIEWVCLWPNICTPEATPFDF